MGDRSPSPPPTDPLRWEYTHASCVGLVHWLDKDTYMPVALFLVNAFAELFRQRRHNKSNSVGTLKAPRLTVGAP
eukprot:4054426-Pyramimonas_sp.AAC.1